MFLILFVFLLSILFFHKYLDFILLFLSKNLDKRKNKPLKKIDYKAYINSEEWKRKAKKIRRRDGLRCRLCHTNSTELHVHHSTYERLGFEKDNDLITLCKNCHSKFHNL